MKNAVTTVLIVVALLVGSAGPAEAGRLPMEVPQAPAIAVIAPVQQVQSAVATASQRQAYLSRPNRGTPRAVRVMERAARFPDHLISWASCVLDRESGGSLDRRQSGVHARNPASSAQGRWQFLNNNWNHGLPYMVADRLERFGLPHAQAKQVRKFLQKKPIWKWHGYFQDVGFLEVVDRGGRHHWAGHGC